MYFAFVDLEKAFARVPRDAVWYVLRKLRSVEELLVKIVIPSRVRVNGTFGDNFLIQIRLNQDSVLSPLLLII